MGDIETQLEMREDETAPFVEIYLRLDQTTYAHTKIDSGFVELLSNVGGIATSLMAILGGISFFFSERIFTHTVLNKLFFIKQSLNIEKIKPKLLGDFLNKSFNTVKEE